MTKPPVSPPKNQKTAREESLARALRDNLRRRKTQAQARASRENEVSPGRGDKKGGSGAD